MFITIIITFIIGSLVGYVMHWLMHTKLNKTEWFKPIALSHNVHHKLYTIYDYESDTYRSSGKDTSTLVFVPIITLSIILLSVIFWFAFQSFWIYPIILIEGIIVGVLNEKIHDYFHIKNHWLNKYYWFRRLKMIHWYHHKHPKTNHGIIWFGPDKLFGTFKKK